MVYILEPDRDGTLFKSMERLMPESCPWAENLTKKKKVMMMTMVMMKIMNNTVSWLDQYLSSLLLKQLRMQVIFVVMFRLS